MVVLGLLGCALLQPLPATARARFDSGFGHGGVVRTPAAAGVGRQGAAAAKDGGGRVILVGGAGKQGFTAIRYLRDGSLDPSFGEGGITHVPFQSVGANPVAASADAAVVQPDGRILLAGEAGGAAAIARLFPNGTLDPGFGGQQAFGGVPGELTFSAHQRALSVALQGHHILFSGAAGAGWVGRLTAAGRLDRSFGTGTGGFLRLPPGSRTHHPVAHTVAGVTTVRAAGGGKIFAAGYANGDFMLARLGQDGRLDRSFAGAGMTRLNADKHSNCRCSVGIGFARDHRGRLLLSGYVIPGAHGLPDDRTSGGRAVAVLRLRPDGHRDRSFGRGGAIRTSLAHETEGQGIAVQGRNRIVVAGWAGPSPGSPAQQHLIVVRYLPSGERDPSFFGNGAFEANFGAERAAGWVPLVLPGHRLRIAGEAASGAPGYPVFVGLRG